MPALCFDDIRGSYQNCIMFLSNRVVLPLFSDFSFKALTTVYMRVYTVYVRYVQSGKIKGQHRIIPGCGARRKNFREMNQKAQAILGWIGEHFWKISRKILA